MTDYKIANYNKNIVSIGQCDLPYIIKTRTIYGGGSTDTSSTIGKSSLVNLK
jgi:hypothetical protein